VARRVTPICNKIDFYKKKKKKKKVALFAEQGFSHKRNGKDLLKCHLAKEVLFIYEKMPRKVGFSGEMTDLGPLDSVAVLGLFVAFRQV
jgi:hypothetical protein